MDVFEMLGEFRDVEPVDEAVVAAAIGEIRAVADTRSKPSVEDHRTFGHSKRRSHHRRTLIAATTLAAAIAAAAVSLSATDNRARPSQVGPPDAALSAVVVRQAVTALDEANGYIRIVRQDDPRGKSISWLAPNAFLVEHLGRNADLATWSANESVGTFINYVDHTWYQAVLPAVPVIPEPSAASIAASFRQPGPTLVGTAVVDGQLTYELDMPPLARGGGASSVVRAWVSTQTYLPVRTQSRDRSFPATMPVGSTTIVPPSTVIDDYTWEPATPANLAVFKLQPPEGFRRIPSPNA
jgi:hypothetical protein